MANGEETITWERILLTDAQNQSKWSTDAQRQQVKALAAKRWSAEWIQFLYQVETFRFFSSFLNHFW